MHLTDAQRRALRTFFQVGVVTAILQLLTAFNVPLTLQQQAAAIAVATPVLALIQNLLEDASAVPAVLKTSAEPS